MWAPFLNLLLLTAPDAGAAASATENANAGYLPATAYDDATGRWRPASTLHIELAETEAVLANVGVAKLRKPGVPDQIHCTVLSVQEAGRSVTLTGMTTTPVATGVVGTLTTNYQLGGVLKPTTPRPLERRVADSVKSQILEDGQCFKKPGDRTGVPPTPPREIYIFADSRFLLIEVVDAGHYAFCRIWPNPSGIQTLTPALDAPLRKACGTLFNAVGLAGP